MLNELERPTLNISLDLDIPKMEPLKHDLDKVEVFAKKLDEFYRDAIEKSDDLDIRLVKQERTKVRKVIKTIEDNRKAMVKAYKEPIKDFEDTSKRIEKILKGTDGMMKELVDADKAANEDPFAGLSVDDKTYRITFSSSFENYLKVRKYLEKLGIIVKLEEEL
jgi:gas vesicle protein